MKHFLFALGLFGISAVVSVLIIYGAARYQMREEAPVPNTVIETESVNEWKEGQPQTRKALSLQGHSIFWFPRPAFFLYSAVIKVPSVCTPIFRSQIFRKVRESA